MKAEIKEKWVKALRSGEYTQSRGGLKDAHGFCCLGVLCDLHAKETNIGWLGNSYLERYGYLPREVFKWAGLKTDNPEVSRVPLATYNDDKVPFTVIADKIEKFL